MAIACVFPGQGSQYPGMGKDLAENFSASQPFQHDIASFVEPPPERFEVECHGAHHDPDPDPLPDSPPPLPDPVPPLRVSAPEPTPCDPAPPVPMPPEPMYRRADG